MANYDKKLQKYIGIPFKYGSDDCYGLVRQFYKDEFGIELTNYARTDNWWNEGQNLYIDNYKNEGFYLLSETDDLQYGDLMLIALGCSVASHAAIYIGNNLVLQHCQGHPSSIDRYIGMFRNNTLARIRHKSLVGGKKVEYEFDENAINRFTKFVQRQG